MSGWVTRLLLIGALLPAISASAQQQAPPAKMMRALDPKLMDTSVDPCVNFYQYSCGGWLKQNPIPQDESSYGRFSELIDENQLVLKAILEKAAAGGPGRSPNEQKIGDYYASCMNVDAVNEAGLKPLQPSQHLSRKMSCRS
jgi:putative endopeptidase